jgi:hypothetical protein
MKSRANIFLLIGMLSAGLGAIALQAQPVLSSKRKLFGCEIFKDQHNERLFYYSPPGLTLKKEPDGAPVFTLLQMRYTGTKLYSDQEEKGFLNILNLSVIAPGLGAEAFNNIRQALGGEVELRPMPLRQFNGELIIPLGDAAAANEKYRKVSISDSHEGGETGGAFWQERTFTLRLDNHESQLLWGQVERGELAISFSYAFYAEAMPGVVGDVRYSGAGKEAVAEMAAGLPTGAVFDSTINTYIVKAGTFPIYINVQQYSGCLKKVDINEELPPAYASFDVRCYDFADGLRPDLLKKIVEIKAFGAAKQYIAIKADFSKSQAGVSSRTAHFPYAIRLDVPLEYRVIEINQDGEKMVSQWMRHPNWTEVIDVTTPGKQNAIAKKTLDVEMDLASLATAGYLSARCEIEYLLNQKKVQQELNWEAGSDSGLQSIRFAYDRDQPIRYRCVFYAEAPSSAVVTPFKVLLSEDDYLFVAAPDPDK